MRFIFQRKYLFPSSFGIALAAVALCVLLTAFPGCKSKPKKMNIVLISIDSLAVGHLGTYGYVPPTTPEIDAFAKEGLVFENAYAPSPWTLPSHTSMFTGLYPSTHGVVKYKSFLRENSTTLAGILKENGYQTAGVVCAPLLRERYQLSQGFDTYDTDLVTKKKSDAWRVRVSDKVTDKGIGLLDQMERAPFFLFLHYWDVHYDYIPEKKYVDIFDPDYTGTIDGSNIHKRTDIKPGMDPRDLQHLIALYDGEIRYTDEQIGRFFDELKKRDLWENTIVLIVADHGEEFLEHGGTGHTTTLFEEVVHVPMILRVPDSDRAGSRIKTAASLVDLPQTLLGLVGIDLSSFVFEGRDLGPVIKGQNEKQGRYLRMSTRYGQLSDDEKRKPMSGILTPERLKYFRFYTDPVAQRLYDLNVDPGEKTDISEKDASKTAAVRKSYNDIRRASKRLNKALATGDEKTLSAELQENLRDLGYL